MGGVYGEFHFSPPKIPKLSFALLHFCDFICICIYVFAFPPTPAPGPARPRGDPPAVLGMALTALLSPVAVAGSLAVAAGSFLYIGASDVVVEEFVQGVAGGPRTAHAQRARKPYGQCSRRPSCERIMQRTGQ